MRSIESNRSNTIVGTKPTDFCDDLANNAARAARTSAMVVSTCIAINLLDLDLDLVYKIGWLNVGR